MKIALVSPYDFAFPGGVTNHISSLDKYLMLMGQDVRVIAPASKEIGAFGNRFIPIGTPRPVPASGSMCRISLSLTLAPTIKDVLDREKFDVIHLHEPFMPMLCSAILRFSDTVNVGTFHAANGKPGYNFAWPIGRMFLNRRQRKLHGRIAVSKIAAGFAGKYVHGDYEIIPNGVDLKRFSPDVKPFEEFSDGKLNILFLGRLERRKGFWYLLKAYRNIKKEIPEARLIVVGPGTLLRNRYEQFVESHGLKDVVFKGFASDEDLPRYYKTADIFCAPATGRESFGIVLLEAMALGKPIIASNISGYASVLTDGEQGLLVPPKNYKSIAGALRTLLSDRNLREQMGARGIEESRKYSWDKVAERVFECYIKTKNNSNGNIAHGE